MTDTLAIQLAQAQVLKQALRLFDNTGIPASPEFTPASMMAEAGRITGQSFAPRDYDSAIYALAEWIKAKQRAN